jgi:hypothetical protein
VPVEERLTLNEKPSPPLLPAARPHEQPPRAAGPDQIADVVADDRGRCGDGDHEWKHEVPL